MLVRHFNLNKSQKIQQFSEIVTSTQISRINDLLPMIFRCIVFKCLRHCAQLFCHYNPELSSSLKVEYFALKEQSTRENTIVLS
jgi:hypothetical protein